MPIRQRITLPSQLQSPAVWMICCVACAAIATVFVKRLTTELPVAQIVLLRFLFLVILMLPYLVIFQRRSVFPTSQLVPHTIRALFAALTIVSFTIAVKFTSISVATTIIYTYPLLVYILDLISAKRRPQIRRMMAIILGFVGVLICINPNENVPVYGALFSMLSALFLSLRMFTEKKLVLRTSPAITSYWGSLLSGILVLPFALASWQEIPSSAIADLLLFSIFATISQTAVIVAIHFGSIVKVAVLGYSEVIFSAVLAYVFFAFTPSLAQIFGAGLILISGIYVHNSLE